MMTAIVLAYIVTAAIYAIGKYGITLPQAVDIAIWPATKFYRFVRNRINALRNRSTD